MLWQPLLRRSFITVVAVATAGPALADADSPAPAAPAAAIVASADDPRLAGLLAEILERNPELAALAATARAAEQRAPQVRALPDPMASLTLFLLQPETRVGPQQASASLSQRLPWFGTLGLKERAALLDAAVAWSRLETARLELVTRARELYLELGYLEREERVFREDLSTLDHFESLAQARYASGVGTSQAVVKIQAELTRSRMRLLELETRRAALTAELNTLRDRPEGLPVALGAPPARTGPLPARAAARATALSSRPELVGARAAVDAAQARLELAGASGRPELTVGLSYTLVGRRDDDVGRAMPPQGNGNDILAVTGGVSLPLWRARITAGIEEATQQRLAAEESQRAITARVDGRLADLMSRLPLISERLRLYDEVLAVQAEESLRSAEGAYAAGTVGALDLLDAQRVLLAVRLAAERTRTDLEIAAVELEGVLARPLDDATLSEIGSES